MGVRGPVPKSAERRLGHRARNDSAAVTKAPAGALVRPPEPDPDWHEIARDWFNSLAGSGQSEFYEASDWATARYVATAMARNLRDGRFSPTLFSAVMSAAASLLVTEGDRRRLRLELVRAGTPDPDEEHAKATVSDLVAWLGG